jgi:hypothetical protein
MGVQKKMTTNDQASKKTVSDFQIKIKEALSQFDEARGFL